MTDPDKIRIKPLDEKEDYSLWRIRIESACKSKSLSKVLTIESHTGSAEDATKFADKQNQASNIIISALTDAPLRVVRTVIGNPHQMLAKLDERYDSKSTASRISRMSELVSLRYSTLKHDITKHIEKMTALIVQLTNMKTNIEDALAVGILVASIEAQQLLPVTAAIKTLSDDSISWESVTTRLIEEYRILKANGVYKSRAAVGASGKRCEICHKENHVTSDCFLNPLNPKNKLNLPKDNSATKDFAAGNRSSADSNKSKRDVRKENQRAATARAMVRKSGKADLMMLDSGTTAHMTPDVSYLKHAKHCRIPIALGDDSTVQATHKGSRSVQWQSREATTKMNLSNTLAAPDLAISLLSIPALTKKGIYVLFMSEKALMIDSHDNYTTIGQAEKADDRLFYISDRQTRTDCCETDEDSESVRAMMAIAGSLNERETSQSSSYDEPDDVPSLSSLDGDSDSEEDPIRCSEEESTDAESSQRTDSDESVNLQEDTNESMVISKEHFCRHVFLILSTFG